MYNYYYWTNFFKKDQIEKVTNFCDKNYVKFEDPKNGATDSLNNLKKNSTVKLVRWNDIKHLLNDIQETVIDTNYNHFGFNLNNFTNTTEILYNTYSSKNNEKYDWHIDTTLKVPLIDVKLTLLLNISTDNYEGGEFELNDGNVFKVREFSKPGDMILFRSYLLHRVLPVTKGERKSLAIFFTGPKFI